MPEILDEIKKLLGMTTDPVEPPVAVVVPPAAVVVPPAAVVVPPAAVVVPPPASPAVDPAPPPENPEIAAMKLQLVAQDQAMKLLAQRPEGGSLSPVAARPGMLDRTGLEKALRAELGTNGATSEQLSFSWTEPNPIAVPDTLIQSVN